MSTLHEVSPEPVALGPGIPAGLSPSGNNHPYLTKTISILRKAQAYSIIPFGGFAAIHIFSVVITPAIFGPEAGNDMIGLGREIYHVPIVELSILLSATIHVTSGILLNFTRKYYNYIKYGKTKLGKNFKKDSIKNSMKIKSNIENTEVKDINEGLGGISSIVGAGSRPSITARWLGLSPLSFSGYMFLIFLGGHVFYERIAPLIVDGDSSMIDLNYVSHGLQETFWKTFNGINLLVITGTYHMLVGLNRYLGRFTLKQRKRTYQTLAMLAILGCVSLLRVKQIEVFSAAAKRYNQYQNVAWSLSK
jgi:succinate dehydrogenase/fumarate reductase cytochrome b subunit